MTSSGFDACSEMKGLLFSLDFTLRKKIRGRKIRKFKTKKLSMTSPHRHSSCILLLLLAIVCVSSVSSKNPINFQDDHKNEGIETTLPKLLSPSAIFQIQSGNVPNSCTIVPLPAAVLYNFGKEFSQYDYLVAVFNDTSDFEKVLILILASHFVARPHPFSRALSHSLNAPISSSPSSRSLVHLLQKSHLQQG
jgi:hypothetical protein